MYQAAFCGTVSQSNINYEAAIVHTLLRLTHQKNRAANKENPTENDREAIRRLHYQYAPRHGLSSGGIDVYKQTMTWPALTIPLASVIRAAAFPASAKRTMLIVLNSRFFASFIERRLQTLVESFLDQDTDPSIVHSELLLERAGAKCFTLMLSTARTVAASSSSRLHSPVAWKRKQDYYDLEAGQTERTPLLYARDSSRDALRYRAKLRADDPNRVHPVALGLMVALLIFLLLGVVIGVYLLLLTIQRPWPVSHPFFLVERTAWWQYPVAMEAATLDKQSITDVIVVHTDTEGCFDRERCLRFLQSTEQSCWSVGGDHIPYNFLIGGDGVTYEARGWKSQHGFKDLPGQNTTLVVGMIGNFTDRQPTAVQYAELKAFLTESIRRFSLSAQYRLHGAINATRAPNDDAALYNQLQQWPHWKGFVQRQA